MTIEEADRLYGELSDIFSTNIARYTLEQGYSVDLRDRRIAQIDRAYDEFVKKTVEILCPEYFHIRMPK